MTDFPNDYARFLSSQPGISLPPTPGMSFTSQSGGDRVAETRRTPSVPGGDDLSSTPPVQHLTVEQLLCMPGHDSLPHLDPNRPQGTLWFDDDGTVSSSIRAIFERDFKESHANWRQTPKPTIDRWFKTFAQSYHWNSGITELVRKQFEQKLKSRMTDQVGRWKQKWKKVGDQAKPEWMSLAIWQGLVRFWLEPSSELRSANSRAARNSDPDGHGPHKHRSGQTSFRARARQIAEKTGETVPDLLAVLEETKRNPDGSFVDGKSEQLYNDVTSKMQELTQQSGSDDPESMASVTMTPAVKNQIFKEVAPRKKGRMYGVGSLQSKIDASAESSSMFSDASQHESAELKKIIASQAEELATQAEELATHKEKMASYDSIFSYLATKDPALHALLQRGSGSSGPGDGSGTGGSREL